MDDANILIDAQSPLPLYTQIVNQIRLCIDQGSLSPGDPLPSVRNLAAQLGIHFNTVAESYRQLAEEGWIEIGRGKRALVRKPGHAARAHPAEAESLRLRLRHLLAEMRLKGISNATITAEVKALLEI